MYRLALILAVLPIVGATPAPVAAQEPCTLQSLAGTYVAGFHVGSTLVSGVAALPNHLVALHAPGVLIARFVIELDGTVSGNAWGVIGTGNNGLDPILVEGVIDDFAGCTGTMTTSLPLPPGSPGPVGRATSRFVVVDGGKQLRLTAKEFVLPTTPPQPLPAIWQGTAYRVNNAECTQSMLTGTWLYTCESIHPLPSSVPSLPGITEVGSVSQLQVDVLPSGEFSGSWLIKAGPLPSRELAVSGEAIVGDSCTVTTKVASPSLPFFYIAKGVLFAEGKESIAIPLATSDGTSVTLGNYASCRAIRMAR